MPMFSLSLAEIFSWARRRLRPESQSPAAPTMVCPINLRRFNESFIRRWREFDGLLDFREGLGKAEVHRLAGNGEVNDENHEGKPFRKERRFRNKEQQIAQRHQRRDGPEECEAEPPPALRPAKSLWLRPTVLI